MPDNSKKISKAINISPEITALIKKELKTLFDFKKIIDRSTVQNLSRFSEIVLGGAICLEASDIHIEPEEKEVKIRSRIDGLLQDVTTINRQAYEGLLSRIKLLSGIKLNVSDRPQDGRFSVFTQEAVIEIRTSALPSEHGESIVLRILNPKGLINLESLGLREDLLSLFNQEIKRPNGMIIITGPTGSGKTTTLYAFLKKIQKPEIKIITIEDPIEYHLKGVSQTQVNPNKGYDFASGLQSIMRQDPDVILVGEIRDSKTCQIALQAALTGHLVFTTLHTNDAAGTVARLVSLEGKVANIGPAVNLAVAQRLIRKICEKCGKPQTASALDLEKIKNGLKNLPETVKIPEVKKGLKIPAAKGCKFCNSTGYQGRIGIFEAFLMDQELEKFISKNPSTAALQKEAVKKGMTTIYQDGLIKILQGLTTLEELERVV
ncbi:MAG: GspE/PulE family protein [bacterium]